jgi:lysophospholipase L1-like esterase
MKKIFSIVVIVLLFQAVHAQEAPPFWKSIVEFRHKDSVTVPPAHPVVFIGSSSFTKWQNVSEDFPGYTIINRAFGGSTLVDCIRYAFDVVIPYEPKQVIIYCGENDLASSDKVTANDVVVRFKTLFGMIRQNIPHARISYVSMKPSPSRKNLQDKMKAGNKQIRLFLKKQRNADFINIYDAMLDDHGNMRDELYVEDHLHMTRAGYEIWKGIIAGYLEK